MFRSLPSTLFVIVFCFSASAGVRDFSKTWAVAFAIENHDFNLGLSPTLAASPLIPTSMQSEFGADAQINSGKFTTASLAGGYAYSLIGGPWCFTLLVLVGPGYQWRSYSVSGVEHTSTRNASKFVVAASTGFNGESFYSSVSYINNQTEYPTESVRFRTNLGSVRAWRALLEYYIRVFDLFTKNFVFDCLHAKMCVLRPTCFACKVARKFRT